MLDTIPYRRRDQAPGRVSNFIFCIRISTTKAGLLRRYRQVSRRGSSAKRIQPFEATALNEARGLTNDTGMHVKCGSHPDKHRTAQAIPVTGHPNLLFGSAEADPYDVGAALVDHLANRVILRVSQRA